MVTPNAGLLRVKGDQGTVQVWDVATGDNVQNLNGPGGILGPVSDLAVSTGKPTPLPRPRGFSGTVVVWDKHGNLIGSPLNHRRWSRASGLQSGREVTRDGSRRRDRADLGLASRRRPAAQLPAFLV